MQTFRTLCQGEREKEREHNNELSGHYACHAARLQRPSDFILIYAILSSKEETSKRKRENLAPSLSLSCVPFVCDVTNYPHLCIQNCKVCMIQYLLQETILW